MITLKEFNQVEMHVGTIIDVKPNKKSRNPAYVLTIDFGPDLGTKNHPLKLPSSISPPIY